MSVCAREKMCTWCTRSSYSLALYVHGDECGTFSWRRWRRRFTHWPRRKGKRAGFKGKRGHYAQLHDKLSGQRFAYLTLNSATDDYENRPSMARFNATAVFIFFPFSFFSRSVFLSVIRHPVLSKRRTRIMKISNYFAIEINKQFIKTRTDVLHDNMNFVLNTRNEINFYTQFKTNDLKNIHRHVRRTLRIPRKSIISRCNHCF